MQLRWGLPDDPWGPLRGTGRPALLHRALHVVGAPRQRRPLARVAVERASGSN